MSDLNLGVRATVVADSESEGPRTLGNMVVDRRKGERRKGERRSEANSPRSERLPQRRDWSKGDRRSGNDRRGTSPEQPVHLFQLHVCRDTPITCGIACALDVRSTTIPGDVTCNSCRGLMRESIWSGPHLAPGERVVVVPLSEVERLRNALSRIEERSNAGKAANPKANIAEINHIAHAALAATQGESE